VGPEDGTLKPETRKKRPFCRRSSVAITVIKSWFMRAPLPNQRRRKVMRQLGIAVMIAFCFGVGAVRAEETIIHHNDGTSTTVTSDQYGTQALTPGHGGGQFGRAIPHEEVVKQYTRPGDKTERR
jgi:hypothetical protein